MSKTIEVYRDATLRGPDDCREALKAALLAAATSPWSFDAQRTEEIRRNAVTTDDVMLFRRAATPGLPSAGLTLWANENGYYVPNVVPTEVGELTHAQYNTILEEFML
ncbi:hypothetical protein [Brevundimonas sp.]|uniref:hypothetical protein n=1 Tax=Brevundimonas sp. TaxID=1871086 RepID=UPI00257D8A8F|nr:hypothetical protein [Brevundimonas sp.]